jgi:predicted metalloprotease with PDZ domain
MSIFTLWIVKRVRPLELGPFDYENEVYTRQLWFFEGFTSLYDDYILSPNRLLSQKKNTSALLKNNIEFVLNTPGDRSAVAFGIELSMPGSNSTGKMKTLRNSTVSYYSKGAIVGLMMHLDIIHSTNGSKSLDDVMSYLYNDLYKVSGKGITDAELKQAIEHVAGKNYDDFFRKYIDGTERLPIEDYFALAGFNLKAKAAEGVASGYLGATFNQSGSRLIVSFVERGSAAWEQGLNVNDEIVEVDGKEPLQVRDYLAEKKPGDQVTFQNHTFRPDATVYCCPGDPNRNRI